MSVIIEIRREKLTLHVPTFKVIELIRINTDQPAVCDFLFVILSNHGPLSYRFRDKRDFGRKSHISPPQALMTLLREFPLKYCNDGSVPTMCAFV